MTTTTDRTWDWLLMQRAADLALHEHRNDKRKGSNTPYVSHVWSVAAIVMEHGGDSEQVAAALLHDVAEDHGGEAAVERIRSACGDDVAQMVVALSDTLVEDPEHKPPWRERKEAYLAHLPEADARVLLVSAADKLANVRSMAKDHAEIGDKLWDRFNTKTAGDQFWYYDCLVEVFRETGKVPAVLVNELARTLDGLRSGEAHVASAGG